MRLERHEEFNSLFEYFEGQFIFRGANDDSDGGIDFIYEVLRTYGPDTTLGITIDVSFDDFSFENAFDGQLALDLIRKFDNNTAMVPIIRNDFSAVFKSREDTPVDLMSATSQDETAVEVFDPISLNMTSQIVNKTSTYEGFIYEDGFYDVKFVMPVPQAIDDITGPGSTDRFTSHTQAQTLLQQDEIDDSFDPIFDFQTNSADIAPPIELPLEGGDFSVSYRNGLALFQLAGILTTLSSETDPSEITAITVFGRMFYQINSDSPVSIGTFSQTNPGPSNPALVGVPTAFTSNFSIDIPDEDFDVTLNPTDYIKIFIQWDVDFIINIGADTGSIQWNKRDLEVINYASEVTFRLKSVFQDSTADGFLVHDAGGQIMDRIIGRENTFYSEYLGSPETKYRQYGNDGCGWRYGLFQGLQIRKYDLTEKPYPLSILGWWKGINPILNLGLGYETIDGLEMMRVEEIRHFYNPEPSVYLNNVRIEGGYDQEKIYNKISIGYTNWKSEEISGIDDPQTKHVYSTVFRKMGKELIVMSEFIAASLAIESTRRSSKEKSADYKYDNNTFIVAINPETTGSPAGTYSPELDENFNSITGLLNPETRYNSRLTPARNLIRHMNRIAGGIQDYPTSSIKFQSAEGNFDMSSELDDVYNCDEYEDALSEKGAIGLGTDFLHWGMAFDAVCSNFEWEDYLQIRNNKKNAVAISQTESGHTAFFIKNLSYQPAKGTCTLQVWPITYFEPQVVEQTPYEEVCEPQVVDECADAYLTENGFEYETEDEECLILE